MIAVKLVSMFVLLVLTLQQNQSDENDSSAATSQSIQGTSIFADGEPLANVELEFILSPLGDVSTDIKRESNPQNLRCVTNAEGTFELKFPSAAEYSVDVVATKWIDGDRRCWHCKIPKLSSNLREPLELVFENRGRIFLGFLGTSNLTPDVKPSVVFSSTAGDRLTRQLEPDSRGRIVINGLEPREYQIEVYADELSAKVWKQSVTVPSESPFRAIATVQFPEFKFGTFAAAVMLPDGKTPAANMRFMAMSIDENSHGFGRKELMSDAEGHVTAKMGVGEVQLSYDPRIMEPQRVIDPNEPALGGFRVNLEILKVNERQRIAPALFRAKVRAVERTDLGTLRLQTEEEVFAWIDGTIKDADGRPVEKIAPCGRLVGFAAGIPWISLGDSFRRDPKLEAGNFTVRVEAGKQVVAVGLEGTGEPLGAFGGEIAIGESRKEKYLLLSMDLAAGVRVHRDIVLPVRMGNSSLKVNCQQSSAHAVLLVEVSPGVV
jgi:hypothetical protein